MVRVALILCLATACSSSTSGSGDCQSNEACAAGEICNGGACVKLCRTDFDCSTGLICSGQACVEGARNGPTIDGVDGDDVLVCPDANGTHCIRGGIVLTGTNLEGARVTMLPSMGTEIELLVRPGASATQIVADLPDIAPGAYVLTAANNSGSADQALTLLQGPPGTDFTPTGDQLVQSINGATGVILAARLPVGTGSTDVAAGDHSHGATYTDMDAIAAVGPHRAAGAGLTLTGDTLSVDVDQTLGDLTVDNITLNNELDAPCLSRVMRYEAACMAHAVHNGYTQSAAVSPNSSNAGGANGNAICSSYIGNNSVTSWACLAVPYVYNYRNDWGDDVRVAWSTCAADRGGAFDQYDWFNKSDCSGVLMACCAK